MAVKNFVFRENCVGSKVAGMETTFFAIFDPALTQSLAPKGPNKEFLKEHFSQEKQKLYPSETGIATRPSFTFCIA